MNLTKMNRKPNLFSTRLVNLLMPLAFIWLFSACGEDSDEQETNQYLVTSTKVSSFDAILLQFGASQQGLGTIANQLKYDIDIYEIEYKTTYLDTEITASGLIGVPDTNIEMPMLSFQHGTLAANSDAPTASTEGTFYASFASLGYVSIIPDFIGFGSSAEIIHPYYHEESTAQSVVDMIRATQEFIREMGINSNGKLFLAGYSEGGYATMVAHKAIEEKYADEFDLIASAPASGGYDLIGMKDYLISLDAYDQPFYLAFLSIAYTEVYSWSSLLSDLFNEPYASEIPALFDGSKSGSQINAALTTDITDLLTEDFRLRHNDSKFELFNQELQNNSPINWQPDRPMYMYHGTADVTVPYETSQSTYDHLLDAGASTGKVSLTPLEDANHGTGVAPYVISFTAIFADLR